MSALIIPAIVLIFAIIVYCNLSDESIGTWRLVCICLLIGALIPVFIAFFGYHFKDIHFGLLISAAILILLGVLSELHCGVKATVCPKCKRKDSVSESVTERVILDRVFSSFDKNGRALYNVTYDENVHVHCKNCGHEYDYVRSGRRNNVYQ